MHGHHIWPHTTNIWLHIIIDEQLKNPEIVLLKGAHTVPTRQPCPIETVGMGKRGRREAREGGKGKEKREKEGHPTVPTRQPCQVGTVGTGKGERQEAKNSLLVPSWGHLGAFWESSMGSFQIYHSGLFDTSEFEGLLGPH